MSSTASYAIDAEGTILWTDEGFAELARRHGQDRLAAIATGRPLREFIAGERPRALQDSLIARARATGRPLELRYRCDAPEMRRFAVLQVEPVADGGVVFTTWFESLEDRPHQPLLDYRLPRGEAAVKLCAWCNRFDVDGWREAEEAARNVALTPLPRIEHSVCEICELLLTTRAQAG